MAKLIEKQYAECSIENWDERMKSEDVLLKKLDDTYRLYSQPVGDGYANYEIISTSPPVLAFIPAGDAYQVHEAHIRGLRRKDIEEYLELRANFKKLFAKGKLC